MWSSRLGVGPHMGEVPRFRRSVAGRRPRGIPRRQTEGTTHTPVRHLIDCLADRFADRCEDPAKSRDYPRMGSICTVPLSLRLRYYPYGEVPRHRRIFAWRCPRGIPRRSGTLQPGDVITLTDSRAKERRRERERERQRVCEREREINLDLVGLRERDPERSTLVWLDLDFAGSPPGVFLMRF